jgi:hypothetical protein
MARIKLAVSVPAGAEDFLKAERGYAEGTIRTWKGVRYQKRGKKWHKLQGTGGKPGTAQAEGSGGAPQPVEASLNTTTSGLENPKVKCRIPEGTAVTVKGVEGTVGKYLEKRDRYLFQARGVKGKLYDLVDPKDIAIAPLINEKQVLQKVKKATPENRTETNNAITGKEATPDDEPPVEEEFTEGQFLEYAKNVTVSSPLGNPVKAIDVSEIPQKFIKNVSQKDIEAGKKPGYILDFASMRYHLYEVPFIMLDANRCLVRAPKEVKRGMYGSSLSGPAGEDTHYVCTLGQLAASVDYYLRRDKAEYKKAWSEAYDASLAKMMEIKTGAKDVDPHSIDSYYKNMSDKDIQSLAKKTANRKTKYLKPSVTGKNRWSYDFSGFIGEMYGTESSFDRESRNKRVQIALQNKKLLEQKMIDLDIDAEEWEGSYQKGYETSFGEKNTRNDLLDTYGVKIKRQNGKEMTPKDVDNVHTVLQLSQRIYGDKTEMNKAANLKISYTGDTAVFARKAIGLYNPNTMTIVYGNAESGFAFAHEFAHYLDNMLGRKAGKTWSTDDWSSEEGQIANKFRDTMVVGSGNPKYWSRTVECFARAMEQYAGSDRAGKEWYMKPEIFEEEVKPLIEKWLERIRPMLKSIRLVFGGSEEQILVKARRIGNPQKRKPKKARVDKNPVGSVREEDGKKYIKTEKGWKLMKSTQLLIRIPFSKATGALASHKYVKRTGSPGNYTYWYKDSSGRLRAGAAPGGEQRPAAGEDTPGHGLTTKDYGWITRVAKVLRTSVPQHGQMKKQDVLVLKKKLDDGIKHGWKLSSGASLATWSEHLDSLAKKMTKSVFLALRVWGKRVVERLTKAKYLKRWRGKDKKWHYQYRTTGEKKSSVSTDRMLDKATLVHQFLIQRQVGNVKKAREHLNDLKRLVPNEKERTALVLKYGDPDDEGFETVRDRWAQEIEGLTRGAVEKQREIVAGAMEVVKELDAMEVKTGGGEKSVVKPKKGDTIYSILNPNPGEDNNWKKYPVKVLDTVESQGYVFALVKNPFDGSLSVIDPNTGYGVYHAREQKSTRQVVMDAAKHLLDSIAPGKIAEVIEKKRSTSEQVEIGDVQQTKQEMEAEKETQEKPVTSRDVPPRDEDREVKSYVHVKESNADMTGYNKVMYEVNEKIDVGGKVYVVVKRPASEYAKEHYAVVDPKTGDIVKRGMMRQTPMSKKKLIEYFREDQGG